VTVVDPPSGRAIPACAAEEACEPENPQTYADFAGLAARRYAPLGVHDWEIWNEENLGSFATSAEPRERLRLGAADSYTARCTAADPKGDGVARRPRHGAERIVQGHWIGAYDFLSGVAAAGGLSSADAVGVHPYDWNELPPNRPCSG
jgi:hypothetical protein